VKYLPEDDDWEDFLNLILDNYEETEFNIQDAEVVSIVNFERSLNIIKEQFPADQIPDHYSYRDLRLPPNEQLRVLRFTNEQFARNPWPRPYIRKIRSLGVQKEQTILHLPTTDYSRYHAFTAYTTVFRSRPQYSIYCVNFEIPYCGERLCSLVFANVTICAKIIMHALGNLISRHIEIEEFLNSIGSASIWFQITVNKMHDIDPKELSTIIHTTDIITIPFTAELFLSTASLYLASWISWRLAKLQTQEYFNLIDDEFGYGNVTNIKMFFVSDDINNPRVQPTQEEEVQDEQDEESSGGCKGYFGNKYISQRLTRYVMDPHTTYNNCLFFCIYYALEQQATEEKALRHRKDLGILPGSKVNISDLDSICEYFLISISLYKIYTDENGQKYFDLHGYYGDPSLKEVSLLLSSSHYCRILNPTKLCEFKSCASCYDWFNSKTKRGRNHFEKCRRCDKCGLKITENHNCRSSPPIRKKVRFEKKSKLQFEGIKNVYVADFETFQEKDEMVVYAAGIASVEKIKADHSDVGVMMWYGPKALDKFCQYILSLEKPTIVFYNGSRFDFWFIMRWLMKKKLTIKRFVREGKSNKLMSLEFCDVKLWDLCLYTMASLKQICKDFGVPKEYQKGDFDHKKIKSWEDAMIHREEVKDYLYYDVLSLGMSYTTFIEKTYGLYQKSPTQCLTLSHYAYDVWKTFFIEPENLRFVKIPTKSEWLFLREGLYGGRCTPYRQGFKSKYYHPYHLIKLLSSESQTLLFNIVEDYLVYLDVVSLYPYVSLNPFPIGTPKFMPDVEKAESLLKKPALNPAEVEIIKKSFFRVDVKCPKNILIAFLLSRDEKGGLEANLHDKKNHVYDGYTLLEARLLGYVVTKVHEWLYFPKLGEVLASYMTHCIAEKGKHTKQEAEYYIHKQMGNNLTGKFSQLAVETEQNFFYDDSFLDRKKSGLGKIKRVEWMVDEKKEHLAYYVESEKTYVNKKGEKEDPPYKPSYIGVSILATSRCYMSLCTRVMDGYYNPENCPYYCDTDSLIVHNVPYQKYRLNPIFGDKWGQLKNELGDHCKIVAAFFPAPKTYALEYWQLCKTTGQIIVNWYIRAKGVPKGENTCTNAKDYEALEATLKERPDDLREALFTLYDRDGTKKETRNTLPFYFFQAMMEKSCYCVVHFGSLKKYLINEENVGCSVTLNLDLHRSINKKLWWENGKRTILGDSMYDISYPAGHQELT